MLEQQAQDRLAKLRTEFETGQARLKRLEADQLYLRETLLRISGAIQVLEELLGDNKPAGQVAAANTDGAAILVHQDISAG
jgi:predicted nuclease with TOPRIM domain